MSGALAHSRTACVRYSPGHGRFFKEMSQGTLEFTGSHAFELTRVNRALAQLARPGSKEEWLAPRWRARRSGTNLPSACGAASANFCARLRCPTVMGPNFQ